MIASQFKNGLYGRISGPPNVVQEPQPSNTPSKITNTNQDWAKGDLSISDDGVFFRPAQKSDTVSGQMTGILAQNSPWIKSNEAAALDYANARGLQNSLMAATSGRKAAIDAALPIAQQDAGYFQNLRLQERDIAGQARLQREAGDIESRHIGERGDIESRLQGEAGDISSRLQVEAGDIESRHIGQRGDVESRLQGEAGNISSRLQREAGDIESRHIGQRGDVDQRLLQTQGNIESRHIGERTAADLRKIGAQTAAESRLQAEQANIQERLYRVQGNIEERLANLGYSHQAAMKQADIEWNKMDLDARMQVEYDRMDQDDKNNWNATTDNIASEYTQNYLAILADPAYETAEDRQAAVDVLNEATRDRYRVAGNIANQHIDWGLTVANSPKVVESNSNTGTSAAAPSTGNFSTGVLNQQRSPSTGNFITGVLNA